MKNDAAALSRGKRDKIVNVIGIAFAFCIAFGGLFLVRNRLMEEEKSLLRSGGEIGISPWTLETDGQTGFEQEAVRSSLTEEELLLVTRNLESGAEVYPHEPLPGQLSMLEVIERGRGWLEDFLMPRLGAEEYVSQEYKITCYLMAPFEDGGESEVDRESLSYWTVALYGQEVNADLILNAVTGQVLEASIYCFFPVEYLEDEILMGILRDYAHSFGADGKYTMVGSKDYLSQVGGRLMFQEIGETEVFAALKTGSIAVGSSDSGTKIYKEAFYISLYLNLNII